MPLDSSIPLQSNAPDPMVSLNSMLDMGVKSLSLAKNRATFDADVARSKAESSTAESGAEVNRANIQQKIREQAAQTSSAQSKASVDSQSIAGNVRRTNADASTAESGAAVAGGTIGSRVQQSAATADSATTGASSAAVDLNTKKTVNAMQAMQSVMSNDNFNATGDQPYDAVKGHADAVNLISYMRATGQDSAKIDILEPLLLKAAQNKNGVAELMRQQLRTGMTPSENISASTPSGIAVTNGNDSQVTNTAPLAGPIGSAVPGTKQTAQIPIAGQQTQGTDLNGNPAVYNKDRFGNVQAPTRLPGSNAQPLTSFPAGESNATKGVLEGEAMTAKNTALNAPSMHANNKGILEELDHVIATGPTGRSLAKFAGVLGIAPDGFPGATSAEKAASAYDMIGKLTERNALAAAASMGTATNAQLEAQVKANGSAAYNPTALRNVTKLNDALITGSEKYATGMQKAIDEAGHVFGKRQFDQQWAQNAHVDTLKFLNAVKTGDKQEQAALVKSVGGLESSGGQRLIQQMKNLQKLTQTGSL